ncbi:MAG TPA: hypothetical protein VJJ23_02745 [Candidatus Nanoarchaeia archaeon]|nr:hypothetical protein [Candidatus Nanoarchaeia archaeon]
MIKIKIFSIITIILLLSLPIVLSEEQIILNNLTQDALQEKTKNMDFKKLSIILPINAQLHITNLDSYVYLQVTEDGVFLPKELDKVNIEISAHQDILYDLFYGNPTEENLKKYIEADVIVIKPLSFKMQVLNDVLEEKLGIKIVKNKSFFHRTLAHLFAKVIVKFMNK